MVLLFIYLMHEFASQKYIKPHVTLRGITKILKNIKLQKLNLRY